MPQAEPCDAEVEHVHEEQLDHEVDGVGEHRDDERGRGVLHAAQVAGAREREEQRRRAENADAQVGDRERRHGRRRAHHVDDRRRERDAEHREQQAESDREPAPVDAALGRVLPVAGAELAGDARGRRVREEVEDAERGGEHRPRHREAGEGAGAEVPDDGGVGQQVERLGGQRAERGHGQAGDLPVVGPSRPFRRHWCAIVTHG